MITTKPIQKAGAIILSNTNPENILLIYRNKLNDWTFPKGHAEKGENPTQTMVRELKEETGLTVSIISQLPEHKYINEVGDMAITTMFLVQSNNDTELKTEYEGDKLIWVPYTKLKDRVTYDNLKVYIDVIVPTLTQYFKSI